MIRLRRALKKQKEGSSFERSARYICILHGSKDRYVTCVWRTTLHLLLDM